MDKILEGLVSSSHPLPLKRVIVRRVVESAETPLSQAQCRAMFALSTRLVLQGPDPFQRQVGRQVLEAYGRYHRAEFEAFFNRGLVLGLLQRGYGELSNRDPAILDYIQAGLRLIMSCPSVLELFELLQVEALRLVCERPAPPLCARLCQLLGDFPQCLPRGRKLSLAFCQQLVRSIAHFQSQGSREAELRLYVSQVTQVSGLLRSVWKAEPDTLLPSLQELFAIISAVDNSFEPSVALASLVQHIPLQMITVLIRSLTTDPNVKDASMTQALCRMIDWLSWPLAQHVETWVIALLKGLAAVQKFTILIDVTLLKIELVFNRLWFPLVRPGALAVLSHMLLSFQHSPEAFHLIVPHVVSLVHSFKRDGLPSSTAFLMQLTELIHCMMYHYSGFPELYEPILEAIKDMPKPTEEKIKLILSQSAWTSQSSSLPSCLSRLSGKSETGKTGLINLGNTCYMNSVIQALFMATDFRRHVLSLNLNGCNSLMRKLQHLFAFLAHTQREAYAPRIFFEASRPPWFTPRSQQDCSEYLRFLLDRLHEEERTLKALSSAKASESIMNEESQTQEAVHKAQAFAEASCVGSEERTLIEKMFGGKLKTTICCLNCKSMSQKEEAFTDLSLAFCPPTSLENVGPKCVERSEVKDDCVVQANTSATSLAGETPLNNSEVNGGCDTVMNEGTIKDFSNEPNSENTANSELNKDNGDMSQRLVGKNTLSVTDLLNYFLAPEILSGDNKYYCEKCASLQNAEKTMQIIEEPEYLILTLLRFSYDPKCHIRRKILDNVSLPLVLELPVKRTTSPLAVVSGGWSVGVEISDIGENLAKKLKPSGADEVTCPQSVPYMLSSVVVHSGVSSESGHYYSYARNVTGSGPSGLCHQSTALSLVSPQDKLLTEESPCTVVENELDTEMPREWFLFNDSRVTFTSFQSVQKITSRFPKDTAYVLFYKKQNSTCGFNTNSANGLWINGDPPLQKDLMDAITKDNKLYLQAWKRRWFVLRSGRLTGDPDVLEYYKNDHAKKPIRIIDLNLCQQVDAGLTFNKKEFENSYIFDINTIDRVFYLVADSEEEMNKWVRCICDICGFNPTDEDAVKPPVSSSQPSAELTLPINTSPPSMQAESSLPPPYQLINIPPLESSSGQEDPQDYLLLINCQSKKPEPMRSHADSAKSSSSETDCNDNVPSHKNPAPSASKHAVNGFFQQQGVYDSPPSRTGQTLPDCSLYNLPRSYSQDVLPKAASPSGTDAEGEQHVFSTPSASSSLDAQMRHISISYDIPPTPGGTYQIPRTFPEGTLSQTSKLETIPDIPPPRPPKPHHAADRSPVETCSISRTASDTDSSYCVPTAGMPPSRSNTISTVDLNIFRKEISSQDCYDIPRTFPNDRSNSLEGFHNHFKNRSMLTVGSVSSEELDENYVPMNPNSPPRQHSSSFTEPIQETNYVPMTPGTFDFPLFGKQVPPPAHMGFRSSPKTPPRRSVPAAECEPPPVDRNLKPDRKAKPAPLEIKPLPEWEELQAPVRSPITRSFARDSSRFPMSPRPDSVHSTTSSSDSHDSEENYVSMNPNQSTEDPNLFGSNSLDGGSSPMVKPKGDKQVEYLDLDLDSGKSTPPRKKKSSGSGSSVADERVDYVVVDQQKTLALKSTREAWTDGRQSTESETPTKSVK